MPSDSAPVAGDPVAALTATFAKLARQDNERNDFIKAALRILAEKEDKISRLEMDLEDQTGSRMRYQQEVRELHQQKISVDLMLARDPYVVVLIDGDGAKFNEKVIRDPGAGAAGASQNLLQEVRNCLRGTALSALDVPILVRIYGSLNDLATTLYTHNVITSPDLMRKFAEQFTNSRADFDFINVGRGKENADSKMRKMFNHYFKNFQCKKIFFGGCHDKGYLHDLREHVGAPDAKERIVLLETTPAELEFKRLGLDIVQFPSVFRSDPLPIETKQTRNSPTTKFSEPSGICLSLERAETVGSWDNSSPAPMPAPSNHSELSLASNTNQARTDNTPSNYSELFLTSNANQGRTNDTPSRTITNSAAGFVNLATPAAKAKPRKIIVLNDKGYRLDPPLKHPGLNSPAQRSYRAKCDAVSPKVLCNQFYINKSCKWGKECDRDHSTVLTPDEVMIQRHRARMSMCAAGPDCEDYYCTYSHHCPFFPCEKGRDCKFNLHLSKQDMVPALKWTEGEESPKAIV